MGEYEITLENERAAEVQEAVRRGIRGADPADVPPRQQDYAPLNLAVRDAGGAIVGGVYGLTMWSWLQIDGLWVADTHRGLGLGSRLLRDAEARAIRCGCRGCWLGTFDFQARDFYERHGYVVFAELDGFPPGHRHFHLRKTFAATDRPAR